MNKRLPDGMYMIYILSNCVIVPSSFHHHSHTDSAALRHACFFADLVIKVVELIRREEQDPWLACVWWMNYPLKQLSRVTDCFSAAELMNKRSEVR